MQHHIFYTFLIFWALVGTLQAEGSVDAQLRAIQQAPAAKRVELMNQFKQRLANMNAQERADTITQMRTQMQKQHDSHQPMMQERKNSRMEQMEHSENMQRREQMQQRQHGEQYMREQMGNNQGGHMDQQDMPNPMYR